MRFLENKKYENREKEMQVTGNRRYVNLSMSVLTYAALGACGGGEPSTSTSSPSVGTSSTSTSASSPSASTGRLVETPFTAQPLSCSAADQRTWLRGYVSQEYFWNTLANAPTDSAPDTAAYFDSMLNKPTDRFSGGQPTAQFTAFFEEGKRTGYGYSAVWADAAQTVLQVRYVEALSPVGLAGLKRGDTLVSVDGFTPQDIAAGKLPSVGTAGVARSLRVKNLAGVVRDINVSSASYPLSPVLDARVLTAASGAKVGYLAYQEFITSSAAALGTAIGSFRAAGVSELIIDLRYNGGGSVSVSRNVASMLGGASLNGQVFAGLRYNEKNAANNFNYAFTSSTNTLPTAPLSGISRVFFITSGSTASASELVINSLKPFMPVISIGHTTFGKPYGSQPREACGTTYSLINFDIVNAQGVGGYSKGLDPTCQVADDLSKQFGDPTEARIAAALGYMATGACPPTSSQTEKAQNVSVKSSQSAMNLVYEKVVLEDARPNGMVAD